jgi:LysM repeat protein
MAQEPAPKPETPTAPGSAEVVKVAAHGSRWDYPKEIALTPGHQIHIVQKGDTLWDLGAKYLGNPFAWPQIWELNKWVKDPHWIYPGDPLVVDGSRTVVPAAKEGETSAPGEVAALKPDIRRTSKPVLAEYAYSFQDFIQIPFIAPKGAAAYYKQTGAFQIKGHEDSTRGILSDGDFIYMGGGTNQGVKEGDRLVITRLVTKDFYHPADPTHRRSLGDVLQQQGVLRITKTYADSSVALIEHSLDGIFEGAYAVPFTEPANIVTNLRKDVASPIPLKDPLGSIIFLRENRSVAGGGDMVLIDQGTAQGLKVGEILLTARRRPLDGTVLTEDPTKETKGPSTNYYLGQMVVIRTEENTSTCRLLRAKEEVLVGDLVTR